MGEDKRFVVQAAIFSQKPKINASIKPIVQQTSSIHQYKEHNGHNGGTGLHHRWHRTLRQRLLSFQSVEVTKKACLMLMHRRIVHKILGASLVFYLMVYVNDISWGDDQHDTTISSSGTQPKRYALSHKTYSRLSSFLDMSWTSWGKDNTQFETLLPPSEIDFTIDRRLPWSSSDEQDVDYCNDVLLFMPYLFAIGGNGQGSQLNSYLLASLVATFLNKALVILEPPRDFNRFHTGSQFGCPANAYKEYGTTKRFPDGLQRLIQHPHWLSRGCRVPCGGTMTYRDWEMERQNQWQFVKGGVVSDVHCREGDRSVKVIPLGGNDLRVLFDGALKRQIIDRASPSYDPQHAYHWAMRLGAKPHEAKVFTSLTIDTEIWDFLSALMSRSGLLRFQPWIARDVAEYIRSSNLPIDVSYDAIHVRRGDKLIREATKEVNNYWMQRGYKKREDFPTNYIPFSHYIERGWGGRSGNYCKRIKTHGTVNNKLNARLVYVATDDPSTVQKEIDLLPKAKGGNTIADNCHRLRFIFSPAAHEATSAFHLNSRGFNDDCKERYTRNIQAIADLMILTKSEKLVADFNSNWGSLIRNFRTVLNDNMDIQLDENGNDPSVFVRDMVVAFGSEQRRPLGW
ncbi:hypothetical protein ACHAW6_008654 [Cyclotella cf. meneghiniana]